MSTKVILVTGATGKQGGAVIDALLGSSDSNKLTVLAVTRDAQSASAKRLASKSPSIKLVTGNLDHVPAVFEEAKRVHPQPIWGVYSIQVSLGPGVTVESEVKQGKALVDGAISADTKHFVYSSVERGGDEASWENPTPIPHFQSKHEIERYLRDATAAGEKGEGMGWTILRPVAFMDNLEPGFQTKVFLAALRNHMQDKPLQWIATSDIGVFAAKAFNDPEKWNRRAIGLAGDELSVDQLSKPFQNVTGQPVPITYSFLGSVLTSLLTEMGLMLAWFASDGYKANIPALRTKEHPGLLTLEEWLGQKSGFAKK